MEMQRSPKAKTGSSNLLRGTKKSSLKYNDVKSSNEEGCAYG